MKLKKSFQDRCNDLVNSLQKNNLTDAEKIKIAQDFYNEKLLPSTEKLILDLQIPQEKRPLFIAEIESIEKSYSEKYSRTMRLIFIIAILVFFSASYFFAYKFIDQILTSEMSLITAKLLEAKDRSINSITVSALIAATVTQTGIAFYAVARYLFRSDAIAKTPETDSH
jgi:hypothetical protein